ncbi:MAG: protein kinase [Planctomycetia bacterium]|nr:MAG: protein kinase [Planctomycetia bacterium]
MTTFEPPEERLIRAARSAVCDDSARAVARDSTSARELPALGGYEIIREIGRGGQGVVYQALQHSTQRHVAVKILRHGLLASASEHSRIEREVRILAQLKHPGIVTVYDSGQCGGLSYVVMDFIDGVPLSTHVHAQRPSTRELIGLFINIAQAVHAAHLRGIIHRDLKPENIRIDADGLPHVLDFGVAKLLERDSLMASLTMTGQFVGSLQWAAPEQARGDQAAVDTRTDVYALGVIFWQALTGEFPYAVDGDMTRVLANIVSAEPSRGSIDARCLPCEIETILRKCLAKEPERRYPDAGDLAEDLRRYLDGRPIAARRDSQFYILRKTIARHRVVFGMAATMFVLTIAAAIGLAILYARAERNAALAIERAAHLREALYYNSISLAEKAYETANPIEMNAALEQCPEDMRGWEYWHLKRLTDESVVSWKAHERDSSVIAYSPDGRYLLTTGLETKRFPPIQRSTKVWSAETGELVHVLDTDNVALQGSAAFSPDGNYIAVGGRTFRLRLYEMDTWKRRYEIDRGQRPPDQATTLIGFTRDSSKIVLGDGYRDSVHVHDADTGAHLRTLKQPGPVAFDAHVDGRRVAFGSFNGTASVWDAETGERLEHLTGHGAQVRGVAFAPDGSYVVTDAWDGRLRGWELPGGSLRFTSEAQPNAAVQIWGVSFSPDGRLLSRCVSTWIELWDAHRTQRLRRLIGHNATTIGTAFSPDSRRVAGVANNGIVRIWDLRGGRAQRTVGPGGQALAWSPDSRWFAVLGVGDHLRLYDAATEEVAWEQRPGAAHKWASGVAFSPDSRLLANAGMNGDIELRAVAGGRVEMVICAHVGRAGRLAWSSDGRRLASLGTDQFLRVWEVSTGALVREILVGTSEVVMGTYFDVDFGPDGSRVAASARDNAVRVWEVESGELMLTLSGHTDSVGGVRFTSAGDRIISCSLDGTLRVWDTRSGATLQTLRGTRNHLYHLALAPDDRHVFAGGDDLRLWDIDTGRQVLRIADVVLSQVALSPDGRRLAGVNETTTMIWDGTPLD